MELDNFYRKKIIKNSKAAEVISLVYIKARIVSK